MKLATCEDGSRDGQLLVVARDLHSAHLAAGIASGLQHLLDDGYVVSPQLEDLYLRLNQGKARRAGMSAGPATARCRHEVCASVNALPP